MVAFELVDEAGDESLGAIFVGWTEGAWGQDAVPGVGDEVFDGIWSCVEVAFLFDDDGLLSGQVGAGDLEGVEEEAGAAWVDVVGGDAAEDLADRGLDGGSVFGIGQLEGGAAGAAPGGVEDGAAGGVVVVAELLLAQAWAAAAVSVGEDVAAAEAFGGLLHGGMPPPGLFGAKY